MPCPLAGHGQTLSYWSALLRGMFFFVCVCMSCKYSLLFHFSPSCRHPLILPSPALFKGATSCYPMGAVTLAAAGVRTEHINTHRRLEITGLCMVSVDTHPLHHSPHYLCISAHCIRPTVHCVCFHLVRWHGRILFMDRAIWGACHMAEVIRWSTGEDMMNTGERHKPPSHFSLHNSFCFECTALICTGMDGPDWDSTTGVVWRF